MALTNWSKVNRKHLSKCNGIRILTSNFTAGYSFNKCTVFLIIRCFYNALLYEVY